MTGLGCKNPSRPIPEALSCCSTRYSIQIGEGIACCMFLLILWGGVFLMSPPVMTSCLKALLYMDHGFFWGQSFYLHIGNSPDDHEFLNPHTSLKTLHFPCHRISGGGTHLNLKKCVLREQNSQVWGACPGIQMYLVLLWIQLVSKRARGSFAKSWEDETIPWSCKMPLKSLKMKKREKNEWLRRISFPCKGNLTAHTPHFMAKLFYSLSTSIIQ